MAVVYAINGLAGTLAFLLSGLISGLFVGVSPIPPQSGGIPFAVLGILSVLVFYLSYCLVGILYCRLIGLFVRESVGEFDLSSAGYAPRINYLRVTADGLVASLCRPLFPIMPFLLNLLGAKTGRRFVAMGRFLNADLLEAGDDVLIGDGALLMGHAVQSGRLFLGRIVIGSNVTVGVRSVVFPDVKLGDGCVIAAGSVVPRGTVVPAGEVWGGVPARRIGGGVPTSGTT